MPDLEMENEKLKFDLDLLVKKMQNMAKLYKNLRQENETLKAEINFYKKEAETHGKRLNENMLLKDKQKKAIIRIEKLLKRMNSLQ